MYVNIVLLCLYIKDPAEEELAASLRRNTRLALDDSRLFLLPSEINVQVFMMLACHGEEYSSPNLSWMLMGHACQQAEALGLHIPQQGNAPDEIQRRLTLFWSLFGVDKSCSLAFGRPMQLPTKVYQTTPVPEFEYLRRYQPHRKGKPFSPSSTFGGLFFLQHIALSKITGSVFDHLGDSNASFDNQALMAELESWNARTSLILGEALDLESTTATADELREMSIGIKAMRFQYLHIVILLLQGLVQYKTHRLDAARECISILPDLVSNSSQVYNGIEWYAHKSSSFCLSHPKGLFHDLRRKLTAFRQLLYFPFTAFFALFHHITAHPTSSTVPTDLALLAETVTYFERMKGQLTSLASTSVKLQETARVFYSLSNFIVSSNTTKDKGQHMDTFQQPESHLQLHDGIMIDSATNTSTPWSLDTLTTDVSSYADNFTTFLEEHNDPLMDLGEVDVNSLFSCLDAHAQDAKGQKRTFDAAFDWFSWDGNYLRNEAHF